MTKFSRICTFFVILIFALNLGMTVYAEGSVTYSAKAQKFIFAPGTSHSPTSLFENFQNVMPGDRVTEQILVKNDAFRKVKIKVYMRSLGAQENTDDFLSQMNLTVRQRDDSNLFSAPADQTAQLTDWIYLGTVYSGGIINLDVTLEVPITMDDRYQNSVGYIDWEFKIEELPISPDDPQPPQTGDDSNILVYTGIMIVSFVAVIILLIMRKREYKRVKHMA